MKYIAIRNDINNSIYIDKHFFDRYTDEDLKRYNFKKVAVQDKYFDSIIETDFNSNLTFNKSKYDKRMQLLKEQEKENKIQIEIRKKYSLGKELEIQRKRDVEQEAFNEYYQYVEQCIQKVKKELNL